MSLMDKLWVKNFEEGMGWADRQKFASHAEGEEGGETWLPVV